MIQIIRGYDKLFEDRNLMSNLSFDDQKFFLELEREGNYKRPYRFPGVQKFNYRLNQLKKFRFDKPAEIITRVSSGRTIYFAYVEINGRNHSVSVHKLNCVTGHEESIISIDTGITAINKKYKVILGTEIIGLSERYAILMMPQPERKYGKPYFERMILIDSRTKNTFVIPDKICDFDTLLRVREILLFDNGKYLIIKTGRIQPNEKKDIWEDSLKQGTFEEYFDHLETLIVSKTEDFIENIETGVGITNKDILDSCDLHRSLEIITDWDNIGSTEMVYAIQSFCGKTTQIKILNLGTGQVNIVNSDKLYDSILYSDNKIYGVQEQKNGDDEWHIPDINEIMICNISEQDVHIYDIAANAKIFETTERVIYIDNEIILTENIHKEKYSLRRITDGSVINSIDGTRSTFDYDNKILYVYPKDPLL